MAVAKLSKKDLLTAVSNKTELSKVDVEKVLDTYYEVLEAAMVEEKKYTQPGFGTYQLRHTAARMGRNPATGEQIQISAKKKIVFKPAKALKERLLG